ncbi:helix-turn-helix domain-containing protein [Phytoactinopolyspora halotolerans]|uniref:Helix-turn-helix transcriptional regulator n=1 Tax=Phytoactinopolyspora halotolerans TaxID=1981512 RepID=A0A6L9S5Y7_9ACTN|nr:AraC family transcriptional regulator [Phytoactinopolyspora halotolerans]NEE00074.1 helix-turn-helix transcriptional regulator [Phytoactinopolyspora halotolerans]
MTRTWNGIGVDLVRWRTQQGTTGVTQRPEHVLFVTLSGNTGRTAAEYEDGPGYRGTDFPGAVTFIPGMRRRRSEYGAGTIDYVAVRLDPGLLRSLVDDRSQVQFRGFTNRPDALIHRLALALRDEVGTGGVAGTLFADSIAMTLSLHLLRTYSSLAGAPSPHRPARPLEGAALARVVDYIQEHLGSDLRVATLAQLAGIGPSQFSRAFKAATGVPPHRFVARRRLEYAARLLRRTDVPITEIAHRAGFAGQSHLTTAFRRAYGATPAAYRAGGA